MHTYTTDMYEGMLAETVTVTGDGGDSLHAYLARPLGAGPFPGVVMAHHIPGWDEFNRDMARHFAQHGYVAICPNLYEREGHGTPEDVAAAVRADGGVPDARVDEVVARWAEEVRRTPPVVVERATVGGAAASDREALVERLMPGIVVMFLLFAVLLGSQSLVEERRIGTLERLMTTRLGVGQLFVGKYLAGLVRGVMQATVLLSLGFVALRVAGPGTYMQAIAFAAVVASAVSAIGLMLGSIARTQDQAVWTGVFFTMFMTVFGGTFFDVGDEGFLAVMSRFTLNRYALDAFEEILSGTGSVAGLRLELAVFASVTVVALIAARLLFRVSSAGR